LEKIGIAKIRGFINKFKEKGPSKKNLFLGEIFFPFKTKPHYKLKGDGLSKCRTQSFLKLPTKNNWIKVIQGNCIKDFS
jgi:hypothetical protein